MDKIEIIKEGKILAHHTTEHIRSSYGQSVWCVIDDKPEPGAAQFKQGEKTVNIEIIETRGGWLVVRQPDGNLSGIIWSDGGYFADLIVDTNGSPVRELIDGCQVRNTLPIGDLGSIL